MSAPLALLRPFRRLALAGLVVALVTGACSSGGAGKVGNRVGQQSPDFSVKTMDGQTVRLSDLRGKPVLVNFWATWCGPCTTELPNIEKAYEAFAQDGLQVLALDNIDSDSIPSVRDYIRKFGLTFTIGLDEGNQVYDKTYAAFGLPTSVLIDRNGIIRAKKAGPYLTEAELFTALRAIL